MNKHKPAATHNKEKLPSGPRYRCEAEVVTGLKDFAAAELRRLFGEAAKLVEAGRPEELPFEYDGSLANLLTLRHSLALYLVRHFAVPRPQALLGHQHFTELLRLISTVRSLHPAGTFRTFKISAAGSSSSVFQRIRSELHQATGLTFDDDEADLVLRVRPALIEAAGWDVLIRLSPRPLSARAWRVCDMLGALNAVIAAVMVEMTNPRPDDRVLNLMCGSGTLLIERLLRAPATATGGCDIDLAALRCADANLRAAGVQKMTDVFEMDATRLQMPDACVDVLLADLPWGQLVGAHDNNATLYPAVLREAARVASPGARAAFITHEIRLMEQVIDTCADLWAIQQTHRVFQGGLHPRIYVLARQP